jgi:hypothetical protein
VSGPLKGQVGLFDGQVVAARGVAVEVDGQLGVVREATADGVTLRFQGARIERIPAPDWGLLCAAGRVRTRSDR